MLPPELHPVAEQGVASKPLPKPLHSFYSKNPFTITSALNSSISGLYADGSAYVGLTLMVHAFISLSAIGTQYMAEGCEERCSKARTLNWRAASEGPRSQVGLSNSYVHTETQPLGGHRCSLWMVIICLQSRNSFLFCFLSRPPSASPRQAFFTIQCIALPSRSQTQLVAQT